MNTTNQEVWKPIPGFPAYAASSHGRIKRTLPGRGARPGHVLKQIAGKSNTNKGYLKVNLSHDDQVTQKLVHELICITFVGPKPNRRYTVNHEDGVITNNHADNLTWATRTRQNEHAVHVLGYTRVCGRVIKLTAEAVQEIRNKLNAGASQRSLAKEYGISQAHCGRIAHGKGWTQVTHGKPAERTGMPVNHVPARGESRSRAQLTEDDVRNIRARADAGESAAKIAIDYPISVWHICAIAARRSWKHVK